MTVCDICIDYSLIKTYKLKIIPKGVSNIKLVMFLNISGCVGGERDE